MYLNIVFGALIVIGVQMFSQNDFTLTYHHIEVVGFNKSVLGYFYVKNVYLNRTYKVLNGDTFVKHDITGEKFKLRIQWLQFLHNEYRSTPILFDVKVCDALEKNTFGATTLFRELGNVTTCPIKKGAYVVRGFNFDARTFPPHLPRGRMQIIFNLLDGDTEILTVKWFGAIEDIVKY